MEKSVVLPKIKIKPKIDIDTLMSLASLAAQEVVRANPSKGLLSWNFSKCTKTVRKSFTTKKRSKNIGPKLKRPDVLMNTLSISRKLAGGKKKKLRPPTNTIGKKTTTEPTTATSSDLGMYFALCKAYGIILVQ